MALPRYCRVCGQEVEDASFQDGHYDPLRQAITGYCSKHTKREIEFFETAEKFKRFADEVYRAPGKRYIQSAKLIPIARIHKLLNLTQEEAANIWDGQIVHFLISAVQEYETLTLELMWDVARYIDKTYGRNICECLREKHHPINSADRNHC